MDISLPQEVFNRIINMGGMKKTLKCSDCGTFREHVSVSYADVHKAMGNDNLFALALGRLTDLLPMMPLTAGNPYVCTKCGLIQFDGGIASDNENKKLQKIRLKMK